MAERLCLALLALSLASPQAAAADGRSASSSLEALQESTGANFRGEAVSKDGRDVADWVARSGDNRGLPFVIVDKVAAKVFLFDPHARLSGAAPVLLGLGRGDDTVAGIGKMRLATISPEERTTPAGRFEASLGDDFEQDVLWIDYDMGLSLHRVIIGNPQDHRHQRLASPSPLDNRISYGCINVPAAFYDKVVIPAFSGTVGMVYILPETKPVGAVFSLRTEKRIADEPPPPERRPHLDDSRREMPQ